MSSLFNPRVRSGKSPHENERAIQSFGVSNQWMTIKMMTWRLYTSLFMKVRKAKASICIRKKNSRRLVVYSDLHSSKLMSVFKARLNNYLTFDIRKRRTGDIKSYLDINNTAFYIY